MAVVVIYGLMLATFLTLIVVPTLYSLFDSFQNRMGSYVESIRRFYWKPYEWLAGRAGNNSK
jgi:type II secretory pathway component PulF